MVVCIVQYEGKESTFAPPSVILMAATIFAICYVMWFTVSVEVCPSIRSSTFTIIMEWTVLRFVPPVVDVNSILVVATYWRLLGIAKQIGYVYKVVN